MHDTVEDTDTTFEEIEGIFGNEVMKLVEEVTDDKSLPKQERKRLQIVHAPGTRYNITAGILAEGLGPITKQEFISG